MRILGDKPTPFSMNAAIKFNPRYGGIGEKKTSLIVLRHHFLFRFSLRMAARREIWLLAL